MIPSYFIFTFMDTFTQRVHVVTADDVKDAADTIYENLNKKDAILGYTKPHDLVPIIKVRL
jgi:hypothetical protein